MKIRLLQGACIALTIASLFIQPEPIPGFSYAFVQALIPIILGVISAATAVGGAVASGNASAQAKENAEKERAWRERQQKEEIELRKKQAAAQQQQDALSMLSNTTNQQIKQGFTAAADSQDTSDRMANDLAKAFLMRR